MSPYRESSGSCADPLVETYKMPLPDKAWWKEAAVYHIYPASFKDSNGDGIGDIPGILTKLDYIKSTGVDLVWLGPVYKSPQADMGYDIADYRDIDPQYGTLQDLDNLIKGLHDRGLKFLMDLVVNHTSDEHEWFQSSRLSKDSPFRDFYVWKPPRYDANGARQPPNNWAAHFGGSAWEYDDRTDEYYLHLFHVKQPDLNWENPQVRKVVHDVIRFWLDRGVDGFRMDVINFISKPPLYPDSTSTHSKGWPRGSEFYGCGPRLHSFLKEIGSILQHYGAFSVGEMPCVDDNDEILQVVHCQSGELNMIFQFDIVEIDHGPGGKFDRRDILVGDLKRVVNHWQTFMYSRGGWNAVFLENHDQPRTVTRFTEGGDTPELREVASKMLATFMGFLGGTLFIYQGQELGLKNVPESWETHEYKDVATINEVQSRKGSEESEEFQDFKREVWLKARDNGRTPMQWDGSESAGFTSSGVTPWMRVNDDYPHWNAALQIGRNTSTLSYWSEVLAIRKRFKDIFVYGNFELLEGTETNTSGANKDFMPLVEQVFAYTRCDESSGNIATVLLNFRSTETTWTPPSGVSLADYRILIHNYADVAESNLSQILLRPYEAIVFLRI